MFFFPNQFSVCPRYELTALDSTLQQRSRSDPRRHCRDCRRRGPLLAQLPRHTVRSGFGSSVQVRDCVILETTNNET